MVETYHSGKQHQAGEDPRHRKTHLHQIFQLTKETILSSSEASKSRTVTVK